MNSKIKILHITKGSELYGAQRVILNLVKHCDQNLFDSSIATFIREGEENGIFINEIEKCCKDSIIIKCNKRVDIHALHRLISTLKDKQIDILHCHEIKSRTYGLIAGKILKIPIVTTHHNWTSANVLTTIFEYWDSFVMRFFDRIIAVSEEVKHSAMRFKIPNNKFSVIINGVSFAHEKTNTNAYSIIKEELKIEDDTIVIGNVGRLSTEKNHKLFIKVAKIVKLNSPNIRFIIAGDGPLEKELRNYAAALGLTNTVIFYGFHSHIQQIYNLLDIYLLTSRIEGTPMSLMEAMGAGVPAVATDVGDISKIVTDNVSGILLKNNDPKSIAQKILYLLKNPTKLTQMGLQAQEIIRKYYSAEIMAKRYEQLYKQIMKTMVLTIVLLDWFLYFK